MFRFVRTCYRSLHTSGLTGERLSIKTLLDDAGSYIDKDIKIGAWVRNVHYLKNFSFLFLNDGSTHRNIQAVVPSGVSPDTTFALGSSVAIEGKFVRSPKEKQDFEVRASAVTWIGDCASDYPLQKISTSKNHTLAERHNCHLRVRTPFHSSVLRIDEELTASLYNFFKKRGFTGVELPSMTTSDCEGGGETFSVKEGEDIFGKKMYLAVSLQLHLEAVTMGLDRAWSKAWVFRAETSRSSRHLSIFRMLEAEMCYTRTLGQVMDVVESLTRHLTSLVSASQEMHFLRTLNVDMFEKDIVLQDRWDSILGKPWPRITFRQAIGVLQSATPSVAFKFEPKLTSRLHAEHERYLAGHFGGPVFVTNYPAEQKPFYMLPAADGTVDCFDLLVPSMCELCGGSLREHSFDPLLSKLRSAGMKEAEMNWYTDLRRYGTVPHGGFGIGWERLLAFLCGIGNVRDIAAFSRYAGHHCVG